METDLFTKLCSYENLQLAFERAKRHKTKKLYVKEFEKNLEENLSSLRTELLLHSYKPKPLTTFILRDPKTRKINKSDFRDRVIYHALCNIIGPIFDKTFIYDSYANRKSKGSLKALERFDYFKRKESKNNTIKCYVLKADIKHYFDTVNHETLLNIIERKIKDKRIMWLIKIILENYKYKIKEKGMPLGNLTSQFFANVYLNELDQFVKHKLKAKYYIRYVDDFAILHSSKRQLEVWKDQINRFLKKELKLELHPDKSRIIQLNKGINLLGFRVFYHHKLLRKSNIRKFERKLLKFKELFDKNKITYNGIYSSFEGWLAYAKLGNTYKLRNKIICKFHKLFPNKIADVEINRWIKQISFINLATVLLHKREF